MNSFYTTDRGQYTPTDYVTGPWDDDHCHAGPPCALLTHGIHSVAMHMGMSRITFEIERQIPKRPVRIHTEVLRGGRKVQLIKGQLIGDDGRTYLTAHAWLMRIDTTVAPTVAWDGPLPKPVKDSPHFGMSFHDTTDIFDGTDLRTAAGTPFGEGPATVWVRQRYPLIEGQVVSPYSTMVFACDWPNGFARLATFDKLIAINTDLTVYFARKPVGDWIAMEAKTISQGLGLGMTDSLVYDASGFVGRSNQSIFFDAT
ncbi:MAG: thioesterase family protein [Actinomycetia bacterium]|nr:thioesterase family protein [Actinomycetes bacterium]